MVLGLGVLSVVGVRARSERSSLLSVGHLGARQRVLVRWECALGRVSANGAQCSNLHLLRVVLLSMYNVAMTRHTGDLLLTPAPRGIGPER